MIMRGFFSSITWAEMVKTWPLFVLSLDCETFNSICLPDLPGLENKCLSLGKRFWEKRNTFCFLIAVIWCLMENSKQYGLIGLSHGIHVVFFPLIHKTWEDILILWLLKCKKGISLMFSCRWKKKNDAPKNKHTIPSYVSNTF